jgi:GntR family transcriptional regulator
VIDRDSGTPLYAQLSDLLRDEIATGGLQPDARLPSERVLCDRYGVSRITVRKALSELAHEGLIYTSVGKGTYVAESTLNEELRPLSSFSDDIRRRGMTPSSRVLAAALVQADDILADRLQVPWGTETIKLHRLRLADGVPIAIQVTHLPHHLCPGLLRYDLASRSLFDVLRAEFGLLLTQAETVIGASIAQEEEARLLELESPAALLISEQTTYLEGGRIIEHTRSIFSAERYKLHTRTC